MTQKQAEALKEILAGVVADDSPFWSEDGDFDKDSFANDVKGKLKQSHSEHFKGRYLGEFTRQLANSLQTAGIADDTDEDVLSELKKGKIDDIPKHLKTLLDKKTTSKLSDTQKTVAEQIELAKKTMQAQYEKQMQELSGKVKGYEAKEKEVKTDSAIMAALPAEAKLTPIQLKAVKSVILGEADLVPTDNGVELFHKGTEKPFGTLNEKKQLIGLSDFVPQVLKELNLWNEKPKPGKQDFSHLQKDVAPTANDSMSRESRIAAAKKLFESK